MVTNGPDEDVKERTQSLETRIRDAYHRLPSSERKIADLILDFPGDVAAYSATEIAELANASKAAATRLFKRLGFASFEEARRLAREAKDWGSPLYLQTKTATRSRSGVDLSEYLRDEIAAIEQTMAQIDPGRLDEIVDALVSADRVWMLGHRNSHFLASYARWQFIQFRGGVFLLPQSGETLAEYIADFRKDDLVVVLGFRRRVKGLRKVIKLASDSGASVLLLTDPTARRIPDFATWTLRCHVSSQFVFDSCASSLSVLRLLAVKAVERAGRKGRQYLEQIEMFHEDLNEFD